MEARKNDKQLREHVLNLLSGGGAHIDFESVIKDFPIDLINTRIDQVPYSAWQLLEHMRIVQWDILEYCRSPKHNSPPWPEGYWPETNATASLDAWEKSVSQFRADLEAMKELVADSSTDLFARIKRSESHTILREALLVADHNAYHLGVLVTVKKLLQA